MSSPVPDLHARKLIAWAPACDTGRHNLHPGETCEEWEAYCASVDAYWQSYRAGRLGAKRTPMSEVPPALRGPNWKPGP